MLTSCVTSATNRLCKSNINYLTGTGIQNARVFVFSLVFLLKYYLIYVIIMMLKDLGNEVITMKYFVQFLILIVIAYLVLGADFYYDHGDKILRRFCMTLSAIMLAGCLAFLICTNYFD